MTESNAKRIAKDTKSLYVSVHADMRRLMTLFIASAFGFISCVNNTRVKGSILLDTVVSNYGARIKVSIVANTDTTALLQYQKNNNVFTIDTLDYPKALGFTGVVDFDANGSADVLLDYIGNNPTYYLYLYDSISSSFKPIKGYMSFPDGVQLHSNKALYYSYERAGCADLNWESNLFTINDFRIVHLGHLDGVGCDLDKQGILTYKIIGNDESNSTLIDSLDYTGEENASKHEIIDKYWNKNYQKFL